MAPPNPVGRVIPNRAGFRLYFEELERITRSSGFDILSHLDVPTRTSFAVYGRCDPAEHEDDIRPVLRTRRSSTLAWRSRAGTPSWAASGSPWGQTHIGRAGSAATSKRPWPPPAPLA